MVVEDPDIVVEDVGKRVREGEAGELVVQEADELGVLWNEVVAPREPVLVLPIVLDGDDLHDEHGRAATA